LTDAIKDPILGLNAARLFGLDPHEQRRAIRAAMLTGLREGHRGELELSNTRYG
jgi:hypothetical protein